MDVIRFAEVRGNLGALTAQAGVVGHLSLLGALQLALRELGALRERVFRKPVRKEDISRGWVEAPKISRGVIEVPAVVKARQPERHEMPPAPTHSRRIPASTTYNAERYLPYRILWAKVIIRATYDYALWKDSKDMRLRNFAKDAERWLFESSDLELSFENICAQYDFPIEKIRQKTRALTKQDVKKLEFRERQGRSEILGDPSGGNDR